MTVNDSDYALNFRINLVVDSVYEAHQEYAPKSAANHRIQFRRFQNQRNGFVNRIDEALGSRRRMLLIPCEGRIDVASCKRANAQPPHLSKLLEKGRLDIRPCLTSLRSCVRFSLATIQFRCERCGNRRGDGRVQAVPQPTHQLNPFFGCQFFYVGGPGCHVRNL